ncbi:hypothetical protein HaLaN_22761 [Haematococcus lacustris]|uniref:F-box domain-containing protein n=1 Tax=Haematococcus lacustris TaxID=44745 RepID=A0A6A0A1B5_HAELA|nr:hypothetical protein HaLaN_22761 [Haematococcus lacustris]
MAAFPSVTSLTLSGCSLTTTSLARLVASRPQPPTSTWALQSLDMSEVRYKPAPRSAATTADLDSPFCGSCIRHLTLTCPERLDHLPCLVPLLAHLTKLTLWEEHRAQKSLAAYLPAISQLSSLQALQVHIFHAREFARAPDPGYQQLLMAMPNLQSLTLPEYTVMGQRQLDVLLLATQLTHLQGENGSGGIVLRLRMVTLMTVLVVMRRSAASMLTQPLRLPRLLLGLGDSHLLPLALHNLCQRCQAGVETLSASSMLAMLQPVARQVRSLTLRSMTSVTTAALTALAAAFPRATSLHLEHCEVVDIAMDSCPG